MNTLTHDEIIYLAASAVICITAITIVLYMLFKDSAWWRRYNKK